MAHGELSWVCGSDLEGVMRGRVRLGGSRREENTCACSLFVETELTHVKKQLLSNTK